jgi:glycerol uptake facilitator-like aquaporin
MLLEKELFTSFMLIHKFFALTKKYYEQLSCSKKNNHNFMLSEKEPFTIFMLLDMESFTFFFAPTKRIINNFHALRKRIIHNFYGVISRIIHNFYSCQKNYS